MTMLRLFALSRDFLDNRLTLIGSRAGTPIERTAEDM